MQGIPLATGGVVVLLAAAPAPASSFALLHQPATASDPAAPLVAVAALTGQLLAAWLVLVLLLTAAYRLPGALGRTAHRTARLVAPRAVRRAVELALGVSVVVATPAAGSPSPTPPTVVASYDWPTAPPGTPSPAQPPPSAAPPAAPPAAAQAAPPAARAPTLPPAEAPVVVRPGDSLWRIAARRLPPAAGNAEVAQAWPRWWSANRAVIGPNPDLVHPGMRLRPPP